MSPSDEPAVLLDDDVRRSIRFGWLVLTVFSLTIGAYTLFGRVDGAVVAAAVVRVDLHRRPVQHREGGVIDRVAVKESEHVQAGQLLVEMRDVAVDAGLDLVNGQLFAERVRLARLDAERNLESTMKLPAALRQAADADPALTAIIEREAQLFESRRKALDSQSAFIRQQIREADEQQASFQAQAEALKRAHDLAMEELQINRNLLDQRYIQRTNVLAVERTAEDLLSRREEARANQSSALRQGKQLQLQLSTLKSEFRDGAALEHRESANRLSELEQRLRPSTDAVGRLKLYAPAAGRVVGLRATSPGVVVSPGQTILEIVPDEDKLVFDARINPEDVSQVVLGADAEVRLAVMRFRRAPGLLGKVIEISADAFTDERSGAMYYSVLIEVPRAELERNPGMTMLPGMPADIFILTERRTIAWYLVEPVFDYLRRSLREE